MIGIVFFVHVFNQRIIITFTVIELCRVCKHNIQIILHVSFFFYGFSVSFICLVTSRLICNINYLFSPPLWASALAVMLVNVHGMSLSNFLNSLILRKLHTAKLYVIILVACLYWWSILCFESNLDYT